MKGRNTAAAQTNVISTVKESTMANQVKVMLSQWETNASLRDVHRVSIQRLSEHAYVPDLPNDLPITDDDAMTAKSHIGNHSLLPHRESSHILMGPSSPSPSAAVVATTPTSSSCTDISLVNSIIDTPIENAQSFLSWFASLAERIEEDQARRYYHYASLLRSYADGCETILEEVREALACLAQLKAQHNSVSDKANALHDACEHLLVDQTALVELADCLEARLAPFDDLERITKRFASASLSVTSESFTSMLSRIDECIQYVVQHADFKDASITLQRFLGCQTRGLTLVKLHVISVFRLAAQQAAESASSSLVAINSESSSSTAEVEAVTMTKNVAIDADPSFGVFYSRFRAHAPKLRGIIGELERRSSANTEYASLLRECYACYHQQRARLIVGPVGVSIHRMAMALRSNSKKGLAYLVRNGCAYVIRVFQAEHRLYKHFFNERDSGFEDMLESLGLVLYDTIRPLLIKVNDLETLTTLCEIVKYEILDDIAISECGFDGIARSLLGDIQYRLVYRAQSYITTDIVQFKPTSADLDYPARFESNSSIGVNSTTDDRDSVSVVSSGSGSLTPVELFESWYPTVRRSVTCLSRLYRCVDREVFRGLSQEIVVICTTSLLNASKNIMAKSGSIHGQLFLVSHLLLLREQIAPFNDVDFAIEARALDFGSLRTAAWGVIQHRKRLFSLNSSNALLEFFTTGVPSITESRQDARAELDKNLKQACETLITDVVNRSVAALMAFSTKASAFALTSDSAIGNLHSQPFAIPDNIFLMADEATSSIATESVELKRWHTVYVKNTSTEAVLLRAVQTAAVKVCDTVSAAISDGGYSPDSLASLRQRIGVLTESTVAAFDPRMSSRS